MRFLLIMRIIYHELYDYLLWTYVEPIGDNICTLIRTDDTNRYDFKGVSALEADSLRQDISRGVSLQPDF